jgi:prepilin-type N-terminal cleavage/methylation domain-containing protein
MKRSLSRFRLGKTSGFTLVELLVVMGIIAILASILLGVAGPALRAAQRAKAANMATQIQTAALGYYTEYSVYPVPSGATSSSAFIGDTSSSAATWGTLIDALCGNISASTGATVVPTTIANSRYIAFLNLKTSDVDTHDAPSNPLTTGTEIYFNIAMDADYVGVLGVAPSTFLLMPKFAGGATSGFASTTGGSSTAGVAVWANCNGSTTSQNVNFWVHTY